MRTKALDKPLWESFDPEVITAPQERQRRALLMLMQYDQLPNERKREEAVRALLVKFSHLANEDISTPKNRRNTFRFCVSALTRATDIGTGTVSAVDLPPFRLANGQHSVLSRLWSDMEAHVQLSNLRSHVRDHLVKNWAYHLLGHSCDCHANHPTYGTFGAFAHHFLHGLAHWTGNHHFCRLGNRVTHPANQQLGTFPLFGTQVERMQLAEDLFKAMARAARQYGDQRQHNGNSSWFVAPSTLPFDPAFDRQDIDLGQGNDWQNIQQYLQL